MIEAAAAAAAAVTVVVSARLLLACSCPCLAHICCLRALRRFAHLLLPFVSSLSPLCLAWQEGMRESLGEMLEKDFVAMLDLSRDGVLNESEFVMGFVAFAKSATFAKSASASAAADEDDLPLAHDDLQAMLATLSACLRVETGNRGHADGRAAADGR